MKNVLIILINLVPSFWISQCPKEAHQLLIETYQKVALGIYDNYWPEWNHAPKHLLLIDDEREYLFGTDYTDSTFQENCEGILSRPATMNSHFLATFPYIGYQPTIIIGTPENTGKSPLDWTVTLLHEHFHQLQFSHPDYHHAQKALKLDNGDPTGMWMLNHPFPYEDSAVVRHMDQIATNLRALHKGKPAKTVLKRHLALKQELKTIIGEAHYRYLNLQLWQEGYARFMELSMLKQWYHEFDQIDQDQFTRNELKTYREAYQAELLESLTSAPINEIKRVYFYALGAAEASLIEEVNPDWKKAYFDVLFSTDHLLVVEN